MKQKEKKMLKCIVSTTGEFGLLNTNGDDIKHDRPTLTLRTEFIEQRHFTNELIIHAKELPAEANDKEFFEYIEECGSDFDQAIDAYCASYGQNRDGNKVETEVKVKTQAEADAEAAALKAQEEANAEAARKAKEEADAEAARKAKEDADRKSKEEAETNKSKNKGSK